MSFVRVIVSAYDRRGASKLDFSCRAGPRDFKADWKILGMRAKQRVTRSLPVVDATAETTICAGTDSSFGTISMKSGILNNRPSPHRGCYVQARRKGRSTA
jgi:hypothetical protein